MKATIFTKGTETVAESTDVRAEEFFTGASFSPVEPIIEQLREVGEVNTFIVDDTYGFLHGDDLVPDASSSLSPRDVIEEVTASIEESDAVALFLTDDIFDYYISDYWETVVSSAKPGSVWCISGGGSVMSELDFSELREKDCEVITYRRTGVAPIGIDARKQFLNSVRES